MNKDLKESLKYCAIMLAFWLLPVLSMPMANILMPGPLFQEARYGFYGIAFFSFALLSFILIAAFTIFIAVKKNKSKHLEHFINSALLHLVVLLFVITSFKLLFALGRGFGLFSTIMYFLSIYSVLDILFHILFAVFYISLAFVSISFLFADCKKIPPILAFIIFGCFVYIPILIDCFVRSLGPFPCLTLAYYAIISSTVLLYHLFKFIKLKLTH